MSLIPEQSLVFSPSLAATLGLEEAILLQVLGQMLTLGEPQNREGFLWLEIGAIELQKLLPFWSDRDIQRIADSLRDKGVLLIASAPFGASRTLKFALNERSATTDKTASITSPATAAARRNKKTSGSRHISPLWQPEEDLFRQLSQYRIPSHFARELVPEFVTYWAERGESQYSWGSKFIKHCLTKWREYEANEARQERESLMHADWRPSEAAFEILIQQTEVSTNFIEDAIPEFVLYWRERGERSSTWNSRFISHVRRQWLRYTAALATDSEPRALPDNWQPDPAVYEVLHLANIDRDFAEQLLPEFVLFWRDSGQIRSSWNTKFLQHVKHQWARRSPITVTGTEYGKERQAGSKDSTRNRRLIDDLTDRSWAV